jgi:hypothetical protein
LSVEGVQRCAVSFQRILQLIELRKDRGKLTLLGSGHVFRRVHELAQDDLQLPRPIRVALVECGDARVQLAGALVRGAKRQAKLLNVGDDIRNLLPDVIGQVFLLLFSQNVGALGGVEADGGASTGATGLPSKK